MGARFIVFEGIDGSGKTTQSYLLESKIRRYTDNDKIHVTAEHTSGVIGKFINNILLGKTYCSPDILNALFDLDRLDHVTNKDNGILKYLKEDFIVICDRYYLSSLSYSLYNKIDNVSNTKLKKLRKEVIIRNDYVLKNIRPDITIFIDTSIDNALKRISERNEPKSIYEKEEKLKLIRKSYLLNIEFLKEKYNDNIIIIDGNDDMSSLSQNIWSSIYKMI